MPWPERRAGAATLIIAPHQDDEILGCGLLLADRCSKKETIHIVYLTDGSGSHPGHSMVSPEQLAVQRKAEAYQVADLLGIPQERLHFLELKDGELPRLSEADKMRAQRLMFEIFKNENFDEVFIPLCCDGSSEHEAAFKWVCEVIPSHIRLLQYPVWARWAPWRLSKALRILPKVHQLRRPEYELIKKRALNLYRTQTTPLAPELSAALSPEFLGLFNGSTEYYFTS